MTEPLTLRLLLLALALAGLAACGASPDPAEVVAHSAAARQPATLDADGLRISASLVPSASLSPAIAGRYGVDRSRQAQLLLVGLREGPPAAEVPVQGTVTARARDLRGVWQEVPLREVRSEGFIDYAGSVRADPPDTLSVEVRVQRDAAAAPAVLRFSRDVLAQ